MEVAHILGSDITQAQRIVADEGRLRGLLTVPANSQALFLRGDRISDPRVRKAIQLAIDRNAIASQFLKGICAPTAQPYPKSHWAYAPDVVIEHDPARARALLKESAAGDLGLEIGVNAGSTSEPVAQIIQSQLSEVGFKVRITPQATGDAQASFFRGERDGFVNILLARPEPSAVLDEVFLARYKVLPPVPVADFNRVRGFAENALGARLKRAERADMYRQIWKVNAERGFVIPICFTHHYWLMAAKVGGVERAANPAENQPDMRFVYVNQ